MDNKQFRNYYGLVAFIFDIAMIPLAWLGAYWLRFNLSTIPANYYDQALTTLSAIILIQIILFTLFGLYRGVWHFSSVHDLIRIIKASGCGMIFAQFLYYFSKHNPEMFHGVSLPLTIPLLYGFVIISLLCGSRLSLRLGKEYRQFFTHYKKVIIVGAGSGGESLVRDLLRDNSHGYKPVAFVDDNLNKLGREIHGIPVVGTTLNLTTLIEKYAIDLVLIAMPSATSTIMCSIVNLCQQAKVPCYTLPSIKALTEGHISVNTLRNISLEDLLGRYEINLNWTSVKSQLEGKTILVTGGGGSIGSEICRQLAALKDLASLVIIDHDEYNLYAIERELHDKFHFYNFVICLQSVTDRVGIRDIMERYQPNIVFHAAAYKHVPLLESQIRNALYNNIMGTMILAEEAAAHNVSEFVLISTDKAVNPSNIMGATKRAAEIFCQTFQKHAPKTRFITVRFGNVLESAGSVVPLFRKQIDANGPVTVTHPEVTRFFMTIPEAAQLILQSALLGEGGEIYVLDMGKPIKIRYLAEQMIKLAGKTLDKDIKIVYTGLRPGEKLYEECFYKHEELQPTSHPKIIRAKSQTYDFSIINNICKRIEAAYQNNDIELFITLLQTLVPEYNQHSKHEFNEQVFADVKSYSDYRNIIPLSS